MAVNPKSLANLAPPFQPGTTLNPGGKPVGVKNGLTTRFLKELAANFEQNGKQAIEDMRQKDVVRYVLCVAALVPKEIELKKPLDDLSDDELAAGIAVLRAQLAAQTSGDGAQPPNGSEALN